MNEEHFREIKAIIMTCIKETVAGEMEDNDNAESGAEMLLRLGFTKLPKPSREAKQMTVDQLMTFMKEYIRIDMSIAIGGMGTSQVLNDEGYRRIAAALFEAVYGGKDDH